MVEAGRPSRTARSSTASSGGFGAVLRGATCRPNTAVGTSSIDGSDDGAGFDALLRMVIDRVHALLADRGYDADAIPAEIAIAGTQAVIPVKKGRRTPALHDRRKYRLRNQIERLFNKFKNWRRIATRYDKTALSFASFLNLAAVRLWMMHLVNAA